MSNSRWLHSVALFILTTAPSLGQTPVSGQPSVALLQDAASYADQYGVELEEAVRRLQLQREIGDLDAALSKEERDSFAGLWIEHEPEYRVVVRFTDRSAEDRVRARIAGSSLERLVETRPAPVSLAQLEERRATARKLVRQLRFAVDTDINVFENQVEIYSDRAQALRAAIVVARATLPERVEIIAVSSLAQPAAVIHGGVPLSTCTGGFTVRAGNGDAGISTAGHCCPNWPDCPYDTQSFQGVSLPFRSEDIDGNQDVQWHSACNLFDISNKFNSGIGDRVCVGTRHRDQQAIGSYLCKWGMTSGRTCGFIQSKNVSVWWVTNSAATFVRGDGVVTLLGDSGGPWFVEDIAYGITSGRFTDDNDGIYMAINYISSLGVSVLTFDPGCGDGLCDMPCGESNSTCPGDCPAGPVCGNGSCESGEDSWTCPQDCGGSCDFDGICDVFAGECTANCPQDCAAGVACQ